MKKIALTLAAIAALSTSSFASQRGYDLQDTEYWTTSGVPASGNASSSVASAALAVSNDAGAMTAFERMTTTAIENDHGRH